MQDRQTFRWSSRPCTNKKNLISIERHDEDKVTNVSYLCLKILHGFLKGFGWCPLVVTQDGYCSVSPIIREDLSRDVVIT